MKTVSVTRDEATREWYIVDLDGLTVGRAAARIASVLRGKHKPSFTPNADTGDFVVAVNADRIVFTGNKWKDKVYYRHSNYPGGLREERAEEVREKYSERILENAVAGMLPKTPLGRRLLRKLKVYRGAEHPHAAQQPRPLTID
ncbi:MAG: 50S ribosomal protein L13 [Deltaproteobacteria bacterium]|nr:MAG: 50S ribosomal protein L13 [Deltaproteobacteria bacterium]